MYLADTAANERIAIVGGGWAGCAAAVELVQQGRSVSLFESTRTLGGRARAVQLDDHLLDNGQHIMLGAYRDCLALMRTVGIDTDEVLLKLPLQMCYPVDGDGMTFIAPRLPAPLHVMIALWRAKGLSKDDKLALARFSTTARWMDWRMHNDCSVSELLERFDQTARLIKLMWRPLCLAALNTPPERASAQVFLNVLRDSLGARRAASDMLLPRVNLTELFPQHAIRYIEQQGSTAKLGATVEAITRTDKGWRIAVAGDQHTHEFDSVIVATPATQTARLLDGIIDTTSLKGLTHEPITTCYLRYEPQLRLPNPMYALVDEAENGDWGQFVFDRGQLDAAQAGVLSVVISASNDAVELDKGELARSIAAQLAKVLRMPTLAQPLWSKVISEKRATFSCTPALQRPGNATGLPGLMLAGDYTAGEYPATLEGAVRSGLAAAHELLEIAESRG
jgi:squalene-associated FAD-dependent desaturase